MTHEEIRQAVLAALRDVAPEARELTVRGAVPLRDQVDLDSFDYLNFVIALHKRLGVEVPEADYARLRTLDMAVAYLAGKLGGNHVSQTTPVSV